VIKDQFMIMEHGAGNRLAAPRGRGTPQSPGQQQRSPAAPTAQAGPVLRRVIWSVSGSGRAAGGWRCRGYSTGGPWWWYPATL